MGRKKQIQSIPTPLAFYGVSSGLGPQYLRSNLYYSINAVKLDTVVVPAQSDISENPSNLNFSMASVALKNILVPTSQDVNPISDFSFSMTVGLSSIVIDITQDVNPVSDIDYSMDVALKTVVIDTIQDIAEDIADFDFTMASVALNTP